MRWVLLAWLLCWALVAPAEVYRWTDEDGHVHYGKRPPSQDARRIELPASNSPMPADGGLAERRARQERLLDSYAYERDRKAAEAAREAEAQQARVGAVSRYAAAGGASRMADRSTFVAPMAHATSSTRISVPPRNDACGRLTKRPAVSHPTDPGRGIV